MTLKCILDELIIVVGRALVRLGEVYKHILELALNDCSLPDFLGGDYLGVGHVLAREGVAVVAAEVSDQLHQEVALLAG